MNLLLSAAFVQAHHLFHLCLTIFRFSSWLFAQRRVTSTKRSLCVAPQVSTNMERMADEKVNLTFIDSFLTFPLLFLTFFSVYMHIYIYKYPPHCVLLKWVSWGTFCPTVVFRGLCVSVLCVQYLRATGWQFCNFPLRLKIRAWKRGTELARDKFQHECFWFLAVMCLLCREVG